MKKVQSKLRPTEIGVVKTFSLSPDSEIGEIAVECSSKTYYYNNLEELCEKWKDYEKPEGYWFVAGRGIVEHALATGDENDPFDKGHKELGNYFDTYEEAKQTVEKLQALKRLKDKGFRFTGYNACSIDYDIDEQYRKYISEDLNILFSGEAKNDN